MASSPPTDHARPRRLTPGWPGGRSIPLLGAVLAGLILAGWGAGELIGSLHAADLTAVRDVAADRTAVATVVAHVLSRLGSSLIIGPLALVCCAVLYRVAGPASALFVAVSTAGAALIFNADKLLVGRPRPPVPHLEAVTHSSFPSGHATLSAAFYLALLIVFLSRPRSRAATAAAPAAAVALVAGIAASRVYLGVHYPSDVIAGVLLGAAWTGLVAMAAREPRDDSGGDPAVSLPLSPQSRGGDERGHSSQSRVNSLRPKRRVGSGRAQAARESRP